MKRVHTSSAEATAQIGALLAKCCSSGVTIFLRGDLGSGKTTLVRGFIQALGHAGPVTSPTYTLIESYELPATTVFHIDLYRLKDPAELEYLGLREIMDERAICLIEWPERAFNYLPPPNLSICFSLLESDQRELMFEPNTSKGQFIIDQM